MDYGVIIEKGATPWQIFQQDGRGAADIALEGHYTAARLEPPVPFKYYRVENAAVTVRARLVREDSGEDVLPWQLCELTGGGRWRTALTGVPAGGLYRVETEMFYEGYDGYSLTRGDMVHHLGVGDVYVVAGQSNACGRAKTPVEDPPELGVHLLRNSGRWDLATHPMNETTGIVFTGHAENNNPGHSPFLWFAKRLKEKLGYPIGIVMAPHGGTPLAWWNPAENGALLENMVQMLRQSGVRPRAMLWYQGEAEGYEKGSEDYLQRFANMVAETRRRLDDETLPVFTVQLNRCLNDENLELDRHWGRVRQAQRDAMYRLPGVYTVPANDLPLYDTIHLSAEGNLRLGERLAAAVLQELCGRQTGWRAPEVGRVRRQGDKTLRIELDGIQNKLDVFALPAAWLPFEAEDGEGLIGVEAYTLEDDALLLDMRRRPGPGARLHGAWRMNPGHAIPQDFGRMPMLSFYGFPIPD